MRSTVAADQAGVSYRQLDTWISKGYLKAIGGEGTGYSRDLPEPEVRVAREMGKLVRAGMAPPTAERVARELDATAMAHLGDSFFIIHKSSIAHAKPLHADDWGTP
jgi:hypothetical protein